VPPRVFKANAVAVPPRQNSRSFENFSALKFVISRSTAGVVQPVRAIRARAGRVRRFMV